MATLTAAELKGLSNTCGMNAALLIAEAVSNSGTSGVVNSDSGALQLGSATTDAITIYGLLLQQASNAVTAFATGGQTSATQLTGNLNRISVCATAGDSVKLPLATAGSTVIVINDGAAAAQVFGKTTDTINSIATATGVTLPVGAVAIFFATTTINWRAMVISPPISANTAISTAGAGTLTAAGIVGGVITRTGASAAYTDTTDTAVAIVAALPMAKAGMTFEFTIKNTVGFNETIAAGVGITLSGQTIIPPLSVGRFRVTITSVTAVAIQGLSISPMTTGPLEVNTAISTAGAGTLTAAGIVGKLITRSGAIAAYSDATDTAVAIVAAMPNCNIGDSFEFTIKNTVAFAETVTAGAGVTLAGLVVVPPLSVGKFLVKVDSLTAVTITGISTARLCNLPVVSYATAALATGTLTAGQITGAEHVYLETTTDGAASMTTRTAAEMFADTPNAQVGGTYKLTLINSGNNTLTLVAGANVTLTGTMTVATTTTRTFVVTFTTSSAMAIQGVDKGTIEAT